MEHTILGLRNDTLVNASNLLGPAEREALFRRFARNQTAYHPTLVSTKVRLIPDSLLARLVVDSSGTLDP